MQRYNPRDIEPRMAQWAIAVDASGAIHETV